MANIFSLYGTIFIDNEKANKNIDDTTKKGKDAGSKVGSAFSTIAKGAAAMGAGVVAGASAVGTAAYKMATDVADTAGAIDDAAKKVGTTAEEYQKWAYAAKLGGMETSKLEALMVKQQKAFSDAKDGSKSMSEAYQRLGVDISKIGNSGDAFNEVIAKLADMEDETTRNALANDIFGKSYADLAPLLAEGSEGIAAWKQECEDLGGVMSGDMVEAGAGLGDSIDRVKTAFMGIFNSIGSAVIPVIQKFADMIVAGVPMLIMMFNGLTPVITSVFDKAIPPIMGLVSNIFPVLITLIQSLLPFVETFISSLLPVITNLLLMLLPPITQIVQMILPLIINLLQPLFPLLQPILSLLQPFIDLLMLILEPLTQLLNLVLPPLITLVSRFVEVAIIPTQVALSGLAGVVGGAFKNAFDLIKNYVETLKKVFLGIIDFIKNVFTGNWRGAWNAVKNIFTSIFDGIKNAFKAPLNAVIDGINVFIRGLNRIEIPDWVPGVGGKGFNVKEFKRLRIGMDYVPYDEFPALLHRGERVLTNSEARAQDRVEKETPTQPIRVNVDIRIDNFNNNAREDLETLSDRISEIITAKVNRQREAYA